MSDETLDGALINIDDEQSGLIKIGELIIDETTGEIIQWPTHVSGDRVEYLTNMCVQAQSVFEL